ncbi:uncharacterized protein F4822DRAFT_176617 [Hypoxylon trugodes]|uniref:uncharacterized protein n=1 Tax=Hypoxylon trugodes TaxID=326681 RepID=UPI0021914FE8|nr:uncharacterized protein F4822DRAFT_176617 [Hypoxylon trugodes]KAI1391175.1 hypothetical protein F4822DRAFT_176617 [Hypoxylon trugodes]
MSRRQTPHPRRHHPHSGPISDNPSYSEDEEDYGRSGGSYGHGRQREPYSDEYSDDDEEELTEDEYDDEVDPEDSASTGPGGHHPAVRAARSSSRPNQRSVAQRAPSYDYRQPPVNTNSLDSDYDYYGRGGPGYPPPPGSQFYGAGRGYPQSHVGGYGGPPYGGNGQVVPYGPPGNYQNPFAPANGNNGNYFNQEHRWPPGNEMMPFGGGPPAPGFYGGGPYPPVPHGMAQYQWSPPPPPPTDIGPSRTPAPPEPPKEDPEKEAMKKKLAEIEAEAKRKEEEAKQKELEAQIRKEAELAFQRKMEQMKRDEEVRAEERRLALERAKKEIDDARKEAEKAAREAIEQERKAEAERARKEAEAIAQAERSARDKLEAERKAEAERQRREAEAAARAEAAAQLKLQAAIRAEAEAKEAAAKKAAEEAEQRKRFEEEAKAKAEMEARKKIEAEEAAKAAAAAAAAAEAARQKRIEEEAKIKAELEARKKIEDEKAAAEAAKAAEEERKKEEEAFKKKALEDAKQKAEEAAKKDMGKDKLPIRFKDAVGRKFSFPFHLCRNWQGMEELIKQAFLHVDVIGPHVQAGHYDLIGPNGEIILPQVWEKVVEPDWAITMQMWPMDRPAAPQGPMGRGMPNLAHLQGRYPPGGVRLPGAARPGGGPPPPPGHPGMGMGMGGMPAHMRHPQGVPGRQPGANLPPGVQVMQVEKPSGKKPKPQKVNTGVLGWIGGSGKSAKGKRTKR